MHPFAALEKKANAGRLIGAGIKGLWNNGAWKTLGQVANRGVARGGLIGGVSKAVMPVANAMSGTTGKALGLYGMAGVAAPAVGVDLPGSDLAFNLGMPIIGSMYTGANLIRSGRAASQKGQQQLRGDIETGASQAAQDFISGLHVDPRVASDPSAYRNFSAQLGHGMDAADTYTKGGYQRPGAWGRTQSLFGNSDSLIQGEVRQKIQQYLPGLMKGAGIGKIFGNTIKGLTVGGATLGLGNAMLSKKPYDATTIQGEGYAAAQAAIQNRLRNMSDFERMAARWDPTVAGNAIAQKFPSAMKQWESKYGPFRRGMLANVAQTFQNGTNTRFYSTDAGGNKNFIN